MLQFAHHIGAECPPTLEDRMEAHDRVADLNSRYRHFGTSYLLEAVLTRGIFNSVAMVSSFGAESAVLLHLIAQIDRDLPVLFIDTQLLFAETLTYQRDLADHLCLTNVHIIRAEPQTVEAVDPYGALRFSNPDACCTLRKTQPLSTALQGYDAWITGRKRHQAETRQGLHYFDCDDSNARIKINPLIDWKPARIKAHLETHKLPRHPLVAKGYPSIGCAPCTSTVNKGESSRAGRWRGTTKTECGLHAAPLKSGDVT